MNKKLPVYKKYDDIISSIHNHDTVIVTAETGSGKSTQIPQMLYENGYNVIVTEPRRIAAISLASRVASELNNNDVVSYKTAFESTQNEKTKILFCTDGLKVAQGLKSYENQILIIDEVHEWNLNIETLIAWIKNFRKHGNQIKVVIMSATIDSDDLANYFNDAVVIHCDGTLYDVNMRHDKTISPESCALELANKGKNVLLFQPGKAEIERSISIIKLLDKNDHTLLPLHSELTIAEQMNVFKSYPNGKIIVATNIAQTSLTVPDIDVVVDTGLEKVISIINGVESLTTKDISQADCRQRAGRAGRTKDGEYYLCSDVSFDERDEYSTPEIQRLYLDKVVLKLISVNIDPYEIEFYHHVNHESINTSIKTLQSLGALTDDYQLTEIGKQLSKYPIGVKFGRMLIEAEKYNCVDEMILAVSIFETGSLLSHKPIHDFYRRRFVQYRDLLGNDYDVCTSDIVSEIQLYLQIKSGIYRGEKVPSINFKSYNNIRKLSDKLSFSILGRPINVDSLNDEIINNIRKCIIRGLRDDLYIKNGWYTLYGINNTLARIDRQSGVNDSSILVGIVHGVQVDDRFGIEFKNILSLCTSVKSEELIELYPEIQVYKDYKNAYISSFNGSIQIIKYFKLNDRIIFTEPYFVYPDDEMYTLEYNNIIDTENRYEVQENFKYWERDDGKLFKINETYRKSYIDVDFSDLDNMPTSEIMYNGYVLYIHCEGYYGLTKKEVKENILACVKDKMILQLTQEYSKRSFNLSKIFNMLDIIGQKTITDSKFDLTLNVFLGLNLSESGINLKCYNDEDEYNSENHKALSEMIDVYIKNNYSNKKFYTIDKNGKKIVTKKVESVLDEFKSFCLDLRSEVTVESFTDSIKFIDDMYKEYMVSLGVDHI